MEIKTLRKIIAEEVHKAIREEVREILVEAVDIASAPSNTKVASSKSFIPKVESFDEEQPFNFSSILQETAKGMTKQDYRALYGEPETLANSDSTESFSDSELPSFAKNAKAIFEASNNYKKQ